jgi:hypothetical protein
MNASAANAGAAMPAAHIIVAMTMEAGRDRPLFFVFMRALP